MSREKLNTMLIHLPSSFKELYQTITRLRWHSKWSKNPIPETIVRLDLTDIGLSNWCSATLSDHQLFPSRDCIVSFLDLVIDQMLVAWRSMTLLTLLPSLVHFSKTRVRSRLRWLSSFNVFSRSFLDWLAGLCRLFWALVAPKYSRLSPLEATLWAEPRFDILLLQGCFRICNAAPNSSPSRTTDRFWVSIQSFWTWQMQQWTRGERRSKSPTSEYRRIDKQHERLYLRLFLAMKVPRK